MNSITAHLPAPGPLAADTIRVVALGGLGEVGRNMTVLETEGKLLIVDCGVLFPEEAQPGVDLILPDFSYIKNRLDDVVGLVLTHGHEDHIGAVPYLLKLRGDIPLYGSELTLAFVAPKLAEHKLAAPPMHMVSEGDISDMQPFSCEYIAVNHSIPDALAVFVRTKAGKVLLTGDFKMDQLPIDGRITDLRAFARAGEEGVDLFCVDSTNAEVPGFVTAEREIGPVLDSVFAKATGQIVVASFASHVHRVQQVLDATAKAGRKVAFVGRSMERNMNIASERGFLSFPADTVMGVGDLLNLPPNKRVFMATGSQGEPMAAISRIAHREHRTITASQGDTVIFASSLIPGNENSVFKVINQLMRLGATVVHQGSSKVHVSGHASAGELLYVYNIVKPKNVMPYHGEVRHLVANGALAVQTGVSARNVMIAEDGVVVDVRGGFARIAGAVPCELVYVDGDSIGEITEDELHDRRVLGEEGFVSIYTVIELTTGTILAGPTIVAKGVAEDDSVFDEILEQVTDVLLETASKPDVTSYELQQAVRRTVGRWVGRKLHRRPMIVPVVVEA
ncbi:MAG: ribonuclease J [Actinomycetaceae bacterium]|nr:ribonuclease J [Actinomycetaceae bacterium]